MNLWSVVANHVSWIFTNSNKNHYGNSFILAGERPCKRIKFITKFTDFKILENVIWHSRILLLIFFWISMNWKTKNCQCLAQVKHILNTPLSWQLLVEFEVRILFLLQVQIVGLNKANQIYYPLIRRQHRLPVTHLIEYFSQYSV